MQIVLVRKDTEKTSQVISSRVNMESRSSSFLHAIRWGKVCKIAFLRTSVVTFLYSVNLFTFPVKIIILRIYVPHSETVLAIKTSLRSCLIYGKAMETN